MVDFSKLGTPQFTGNDYEITNSGGSFGPSVMVRKAKDGALYEEERDGDIPYDTVPQGQYEIEITGFQKRFELPRPQQYMKPGMDPMVSKTRLEFTIIAGPQKGKKFLDLYTWSVSEKAALAKLLVAVTGQPIPARWAMPQVLGLRFRAYVRHAKDQNGQVKIGRDGNPFPGVSVDTVEPLTATPAADAADDGDEPIVAWTDFWRFAKSYGFNPKHGMTGIEAALKAPSGSFEEMTPEAVYKLLAAHVGHED